MPYLTGDSVSGDVCCRILRMPADDRFVNAVSGALLELAYERNWEQFGTVTPEEAAQAALAALEEFWESNCMIGMIGYWGGILPDNVLRCDGNQHQRVDYPDLYQQLHSTYIVDADNFVTPDITGRFVWAGNATQQGDTGGENQVTLTVNEIPSHTHQTPPHTHGIHNHLSVLAVSPGEVPFNTPNPLPAVTAPASPSTLPRGGDGAHENRPRYIRLVPGIIAK